MGQKESQRRHSYCSKIPDNQDCSQASGLPGDIHHPLCAFSIEQTFKPWMVFREAWDAAQSLPGVSLSRGEANSHPDWETTEGRDEASHQPGNEGSQMWAQGDTEAESCWRLMRMEKFSSQT